MYMKALLQGSRGMKRVGSQVQFEACRFRIKTTGWGALLKQRQHISWIGVMLYMTSTKDQAAEKHSIMQSACDYTADFVCLGHLYQLCFQAS